VKKSTFFRIGQLVAWATYAFSEHIGVVILRNAVTKDLYVQLAKKRFSATTAIEILRPAWNGELRMTVTAF